MKFSDVKFKQWQKLFRLTTCAPRLKDLIKIDPGKNYIAWYEILPGQNNKLSCTYVRLKGLKILSAHRRDVGISDKFVTQILILK